MSKEVVVVLLVLTVVVALVGTISVTQTASNIEITKVSNSEGDGGKGNVRASGLVIQEPARAPVGKTSITFLNPGDELQ